MHVAAGLSPAISIIEHSASGWDKPGRDVLGYVQPKKSPRLARAKSQSPEEVSRPAREHHLHLRERVENQLSSPPIGFRLR
jgi:hypothetical protein